MKFYIISLFLCLSWAGKGIAQNLAYSTLMLPDSLKQNANAVLRQFEEVFEIENTGKATHKIKMVCTVLNSDGDKHAVLYINQDKFNRLKSLDGNLYDATGNLVTKLKKQHIREDVFERSYEYTDDKYTIAKFDYGQYPYTVEFEYEVSDENLMFYSIFQPQDSPDVAVQSAQFTIIAPETIKFRYKEVNLQEKGTATKNSSKKIHTWKVKGLPAFKPIPYSPPFEEIVPTVYTAPNNFEVSGYKGNMESWNNLGKFQNILNQERTALPPATVEHLKKITEGVADKREKAKRVYEYMQGKTRYVSIQLGIGGWQPIAAETVDKKGYGDCKALSNYMKSMLAEVGIESHYTIINAGDVPRKTYPDFTSSYFNHIILCVPMERDTVWLECTSQTQPFNFLGSFTHDRYCLLVTPQGGKLARTPKYPQKMNTENHQIQVKILPTGEANVKAVATYTGMETENDDMHFLIQETRGRQKQWMLENHLQMPSYDLVDFSLKEDKSSSIPKIVETIEANIKSLGAKNGKRIFFAPNLMSKFTISLPEDGKRKHDIFTNFADFTASDTVRYELPEGYHIEGTPTEHNLKTVFGEYRTTIKIEQGTVIYIRTLSMKGGRYPREKYQEMADFFKNITKADNTKLVLVKET